MLLCYPNIRILFIYTLLLFHNYNSNYAPDNTLECIMDILVMLPRFGCNDAIENDCGRTWESWNIIFRNSLSQILDTGIEKHLETFSDFWSMAGISINLKITFVSAVTGNRIIFMNTNSDRLSWEKKLQFTLCLDVQICCQFIVQF